MDKTRLQSFGIALLRVVVGAVFVVHGGQKLFVWGLAGVTQAFTQMGLPLPALSAGLVTSAEFLGGLLLIVGLFTRVAALPLAATMVVAIFAVHLEGGFFLPNGYEYALTMLAASVGLALTGPGALALDNVRAERRAGFRLFGGELSPERAA